MRQNEASREARKKEKLEKDLRNVQTELDSKQTDIRILQQTLQKNKEELQKLEQQLKEHKVRNPEIPEKIMCILIYCKSCTKYRTILYYYTLLY